MRRRLLWLVALAGFVWLYLRHGGRRPQPVVQIPPAADAAGELRRKLDEAKERAEPEATEPAVEPEAEPAAPNAPAAPAADNLDAKRREVHDRARSAADEMRHSSTD